MDGNQEKVGSKPEEVKTTQEQLTAKMDAW
jgi:hypothetical protein